MESQTAWLIDSVIEQNRSTLETDMRVQEIQSWKTVISSKWAVVVVVVMMILPILLSKLVGMLIK